MKLFPGFARRKISTSGARINLVTGGNGPAVLLLHGYPETHVMWHKVAPALARDYTVVCADLRGYGDSSKPKGLPDHSNYSKRAMAQDMAEVMTRPRAPRVPPRRPRPRRARRAPACAGSRGARAQPRRARHLADAARVREHGHGLGARLLPLVLPDPARADARAHDRAACARITCSGASGADPAGLKDFPQAVQREYLRCFDARGIHGTCEDYRAAATIDLVHDRKSLKKKLAMPVLALWAQAFPGRHDVRLPRRLARSGEGRARPRARLRPFPARGAAARSAARAAPLPCAE